jgi:hypothetical protein
MTTLMQAVERAREHEGWPPSGGPRASDLMRRFQPASPGSVRSLLAAMNDKAALKRPWAVILCRFQGAAADPAVEGPIEQFYRGIFSPGSGGLVEYWRDVSLGVIDISQSRVFGWVEIDIPRAKAGVGSGENRSTLVRRAVEAVQRAGGDPLEGFHSQIAVYTENWAKDGAPPGADWRDPVWGGQWIDGSADGAGKVTLTPPHDGDITAHEMGHGFGMQHDVGADMVTHYADPCCIMSQRPTFVHPAWNVSFGPAVCIPHLVQRGWMYSRRVFHDAGAWQGEPDGVSRVLAPVDDPGVRADLGLQLGYTNGQTAWEYFVEYARPRGWDRGLSGSFVFIRRLGPGKDTGETPIILGTIQVPSAGTSAELIEPSGNVRFRVTRADPDGRTVSVSAAAL